MKYSIVILFVYIFIVTTIHYIDNKPLDVAFFLGSIVMFMTVIIGIIMPELYKNLKINRKKY